MTLAACAPAARAQVIFQQFYYPTDPPPNGVSWWKQAAGQLPALAKLGVTAVWNPVPVKGGSGAQSMGYDPYDLYDLGSKDQKGSVATRFGTRDEYLAYVAIAHANGLRVYSDVVLNHRGGADGVQENPLMEKLGMDDIPDDSKVPPAMLPPGYVPGKSNVRGWTLYRPKGFDGRPGTGRFPSDLRHFHPSETHPDRNPEWHAKYFLEDFCQEADGGYVAKNLVAWGEWFKARTGVDGYRLDAVKLIDPAPFLDDFSRAVTSDPTPSGGAPFFLVGEFWDTNPSLLSSFQTATHRQMSLFDFGLYYAMRDMVTKPGTFDMRDLMKRRFAERDRAVTFVTNHDVDRDQEPMPRARRALPYAVTMVLSGRPSVFYKDYFAPEDKALPATLEALVPMHNRFAKGDEVVRYADADLLAVERGPGSLLGIFNDGGTDKKPRTEAIPTGFGANVRLRAVGAAVPNGAGYLTDGDGRVTVTVPAGGYLLLVRADATEKTAPDRFPRRPLPTTQVVEFADDLDTGRLGPDARTLTVTAAKGTDLSLRLSGLTGQGRATITVTAPSGKRVATYTADRARGADLRANRLAEAGTYRITVTAPGTPTTGRLSVTYTAPASLDKP